MRSEHEKGQIDDLHAQVINPSEIASEIQMQGSTRGRMVARNYLLNPTKYGKTKRGGRKRVLTIKEECRLLRTASKSDTSATQLKFSPALPISAVCTRAYLYRSVTLQHMKLKKAPALSALHKQAGLDWAREQVTWTTSQLGPLVFFDEKILYVANIVYQQTLWEYHITGFVSYVF